MWWPQLWLPQLVLDTIITNTLFQQHKRRLYTWTSLDGQHRNQNDYILCSQRWRSSIQSAKTRLGADCGSDHELLIAKFRLKLKKVEKTTRPFSSVQFTHSVMSDSLWPHESQHARPPCPSPTPRVYSNSCLSSQWCHPAISSSVVPLLLLPPIPPSIRVFSNESTLHMRWPKYWSFSFSIIPSEEIPGLISFRMDWLHLLAVQGTLKSLLQHHSSKASILPCSAFFMVQLSHPYMITGKTIALTRRIFVGKVMSLLLNMLSRLVITFLPRS